MDTLAPDMLLKVIACASDLISQYGFSHRGGVANQTEVIHFRVLLLQAFDANQNIMLHSTLLTKVALHSITFDRYMMLQALSKLVSVLPANVSTAVMAEQSELHRQEDILARTERLLALYESKVTPVPQGGKQVGMLQHTNNVPNLFVGCPANEPLPAPSIDVAPEHNVCQKGKEQAAGKGKGALLESVVPPCKDGSMPKIDLQSQDASMQPDITNSQLQFLQCLQNSQDALPECPVGASQENLFPLSQVGTGASDPLMSTPLSQGPWGGFSSDPIAGTTTSQLLASQPASMAPGAEKEEAS